MKFNLKHINKLPLLTTDRVTIGYLTLTGMAIPVFYNRIDNPAFHIFLRVAIIAALLILAMFQNSRKYGKPVLFLRYFLPLVMLSYVYGDTAALNRIVFRQPLDEYFRQLDLSIFGFEPALEFSKRFPYPWLSELLNLSYFSYYFMLITIAGTYYFFRKSRTEKVVFIILASFYSYYIIFILFPVVGPQFYFSPPENQALHSGLFSSMVEWVQKNWEHPTGAFPSSHVGMATIYLLISRKDFKPLFYVLLPFAFLILFATVYIKAHYAADVIGGLVTAPIFYLFAAKWYDRLSKKG